MGGKAFCFKRSVVPEVGTMQTITRLEREVRVGEQFGEMHGRTVRGLPTISSLR